MKRKLVISTIIGILLIITFVSVQGNNITDKDIAIKIGTIVNEEHVITIGEVTVGPTITIGPVIEQEHVITIGEVTVGPTITIVN